MTSDKQYVLSIDPGVSTGISLLSYGADTAPELVQGWQFTGGVSALKKWLREHWRPSGWDSYNDEPRYAGLYHWKVGATEALNSETTVEYDFERGDDDDYEVMVPPNLVVVSEKFTARATKGFSYTTASLEPLRGEGALIALDLMPDYTAAEKRWLDPRHQYLVGGKDLPDKKKRQHAFLKDSGFYRTNKDFPDSPAKDGADDFRSSCAHGISYLARTGHKPSFDMMTEWSNR